MDHAQEVVIEGALKHEEFRMVEVPKGIFSTIVRNFLVIELQQKFQLCG
jgi:hypothetical protein